MTQAARWKGGGDFSGKLQHAVACILSSEAVRGLGGEPRSEKNKDSAKAEFACRSARPTG